MQLQNGVPGCQWESHSRWVFIEIALLFHFRSCFFVTGRFVHLYAHWHGLFGVLGHCKDSQNSWPWHASCAAVKSRHDVDLRGLNEIQTEEMRGMKWQMMKDKQMYHLSYNKYTMTHFFIAPRWWFSSQASCFTPSEPGWWTTYLSIVVCGAGRLIHDCLQANTRRIQKLARMINSLRFGEGKTNIISCKDFLHW